MALLSSPEPGDLQPASANRIKVLYIGGTGRTGSTLLEKLLGQLPGVFNAGELTWLWYGLLGDGRCSCGERLATCTVWQQVFEHAYGGLDEIDVRATHELRRRGNSWHLPTMVLPAARRRLLRRLDPLPEQLGRLYRAIQVTTGAQIIVDASKEPHYSWILRSQADIDVHFLHLVRDPRAIAFSWTRVKPEQGFDGTVLLERRNAATSAMYHDVSNAVGEILWERVPGRYLRLRYEDLIADPVGTVAAIGRFMGAEFDASAFLEGDVANLHATHSAWGNPNRFESGPVSLRPDEEWRSGLTARDRTVTTLLTLPFLRRYGYPVRTGPAPRSAAPAAPGPPPPPH